MSVGFGKIAVNGVLSQRCFGTIVGAEDRLKWVCWGGNGSDKIDRASMEGLLTSGPRGKRGRHSIDVNRKKMMWFMPDSFHLFIS